MTSLFLDTSFVIALEARDDQHHPTALLYWKKFQISPRPLVTTSYVVDELVTYFNSRNHHAKAVQVGRRLMDSALVNFLHVDETLFSEGWALFQHHSDKRYSLTDCISFAVMERLKIKTALTFDKHFLQAGFEKKP